MNTIEYLGERLGTVHKCEGHICINIQPIYHESQYKVSEIRVDIDCQHVFVMLTKAEKSKEVQK